MNKRRSILHWIIRDFLSLVIFLILFMVVLSAFTYLYYAQDIVDKDTVMNRNDTGFILSDRTGQPFFSFDHHKYNTFAPLSQISLTMQQTVIAAEDKDFYRHPGFSVTAIARSVYKDIATGQLAFGGSTITQQLVKNVLLNSNKSFLRKYQELILASEIERRFSKTEILEMYLNSVYFGQGAFGAEEAAQVYFGKHARELDLAEASFLAGLLPAPSRLSQISTNFGEAKVRQHYVLQNMVAQKYISKTQAEATEAEKLNFQPPENPFNSEAIHFALLVRDRLIQMYGEERIARSGFQIKTTLDLEFQTFAEEEVKNQVAKLAPNNVSNGAAVAIDPKTGEIEALVGSYNWYDSKFGQVAIPTVGRQPGSSFKPIVYSAALESGKITLATILHDQPTNFDGGYRPKDYDGSFRGAVTPRRALANSLNIPSVEVMAKVGVPEALNMARRLGITTLDDPSQYGLSLVLGAGEVKLLDLATVYGTLANRGIRNDPVTILEIRDKRNQIVYQYQPNPQPVLSPKVAFLISSVLSDNRARAEIFGNTLDMSRPAAVKTGTTENYRDAWTMGYTPSLVVGTWVGNNDGRPMDNIAGSLGAAPIWKSLMEKFLAGTTVEKFNIPEGIVTCQITAPTYRTATSSAYPEYFISGTQPSSCKTAAPHLDRLAL